MIRKIEEKIDKKDVVVNWIISLNYKDKNRLKDLLSILSISQWTDMWTELNDYGGFDDL